MRKHLKDYFIPHAGNDYKPHSLQKVAMTGMVGLVMLSFALASAQSLLWVASDWMVGAVLPSVIVDMVNEERSTDSLVQLKRNPVLDAAAQMKANDMSKYSYFAHFSPTGVSPWFFFNKSQYNFVNAGENLAVHFSDTKQLVNAWVASPTHRANIMNAAYTETGIGIAEGEFEGFKTLYVVQFFGTPAGTSPVSIPSPVAVAQAQEPESESRILEETTPATFAQQSTEEATPQETQVLAEAVEITESIDIIPADPVPVTVATIEEETPPSVQTEQTQVAENDLPETYRESMYSDFLATTTGGIPASIDDSGSAESKNASYFLRVLTQPHVALQVIYVVIGLFVLLSLILSVGIEMKKQNPAQIGYSLGLLALMTGLFYIQGILSSGTLIL